MSVSSASVFCTLAIKAVPNAPRSAVVGWLGDALKIKIHAPALDGRANDALCEFLADTLGLSETQVVHVALANLARQTLPRYELDDGPLTQAQMDAIDRLQPPGRMKVTKSLF